MLFCAFLVFEGDWRWLGSPQGAKPSIYLHTRQRNQSCLLHLPATVSTWGSCAPQPALRGANQLGPLCRIFGSSQPGLGLLDGDQRGTRDLHGWLCTAQGAPAWLPARRTIPPRFWVQMDAPLSLAGVACVCVYFTPSQLRRRGANPQHPQGCSGKHPAAEAAPAQGPACPSSSATIPALNQTSPSQTCRVFMQGPSTAASAQDPQQHPARRLWKV